MKRLHMGGAWALVVACGVVGASGVHAEKSRRMTADAVKLKGLTLQKTVDADLDGDGRKELLGVCTGPKGVQVVLIGEDDEGAVVTQVMPPALGKTLGRVWVKSLVPPKDSAQLLVEVYDETPDEKVKRIRIYGGDGGGKDVKIKEIFTAKIERSKSVDDRPEWETDKDVIQYGDARAGWVFEDLQDDGVMEIAVRRNSSAQIIRIPKEGGGAVKLLTGVRERVWSWDVDKGRYTEGAERLYDFLPAYTVTSVAASSAWVEPHTLKELKAQALSDALSTAAATDATGKGPAKKLTDDPKVDLTPFIQPAADGKLETAWIEDAKNDGKGEWVDVTLDGVHPIHMVRLVLGCVNTKRDFRSHNVPESFHIQLDNGAEQEVDRRKRGHFDGEIRAFSDNLVKLSDRPWAKTTLVFFDGKEEAKKVRVILGKAIRQGRGNQTCISEISVH